MFKDNEIKGKVKQVKGKVKEKAGEITNNPDLQYEVSVSRRSSLVS